MTTNITGHITLDRSSIEAIAADVLNLARQVELDLAGPEPVEGAQQDQVAHGEIADGRCQCSGLVVAAVEQLRADLNRSLGLILELLKGAHVDSSTGAVPAATGLTVSVEVAARRGHDSDPDEKAATK